MSEWKWNIEFVKLMHDHTKHLTTLSTGSIVVLVTFYEKLAATPSWTPLVIVALVAFVCTILAATLSQILLLPMSEPVHQESTPARGLWAESPPLVIFLLASWLAFIIAVISLGVFGVRNV